MTVREICEYIAKISIIDYLDTFEWDTRQIMNYISFDMVYRGEYYG